jgi:hypothetical protein
LAAFFSTGKEAGFIAGGDVPRHLQSNNVTACDGLRQCKVQFAGIENSAGIWSRNCHISPLGMTFNSGGITATSTF